MNYKTLNLMEEAIATAGAWTWLELASDSIQLEFNNVQLYKPSFKPHEIHSSEITIRLANNSFFSIFYDDNSYSNLSEILSANDFVYHLNVDKFKFQDFDFFTETINSFSYEKNLFGKKANAINEGDLDFLLVYSAEKNNEKIAIVSGANQLNFFNEFESLNQETIKELSNEWWVYWMDYWKSKGTINEYYYDSACEAIPFSNK